MFSVSCLIWTWTICQQYPCRPILKLFNVRDIMSATLPPLCMIGHAPHLHNNGIGWRHSVPYCSHSVPTQNPIVHIMELCHVITFPYCSETSPLERNTWSIVLITIELDDIIASPIALIASPLERNTCSIFLLSTSPCMFRHVQTRFTETQTRPQFGLDGRDK